MFASVLVRAARASAFLALLVLATPASAQHDPRGLVDVLNAPAAEHVDQLELFTLVRDGRGDEAFEDAFEHGDALFETVFNALDGVGAKVGDGQRFTRVPRADLGGPGEWATHVPARATGPNAESCNACHRVPGDDGAGRAETSVHRDPLHLGRLDGLLLRSTPHLFGAGALQRLAEEMTAELHEIRRRALAEAAGTGQPATHDLASKGIAFGFLTARPDGSLNTDQVRGVDRDLVVRPFQWKGSVAFLRDFNRGAAHNEIGMQAVELVGDGVDGDGDQRVDELVVGDMTALAIYVAAQPRPTSRLELDRLGLLDPPLAPGERARIRRGLAVLRQVGCDVCHVPSLRLDDPRFQEPSAAPEFRDALFPAGQDPLVLGVDPALPVTFDLTVDQPDNVVERPDGTVFRLGSLVTTPDGRARVDLFGDLRQHDLGPALAESIDEVGTGASVFLTENLWGVGSTAPYLHDGRATTLTEAILAHGGEALDARQRFVALAPDDQAALLAFLDNLVLFKLP